MDIIMWVVTAIVAVIFTVSGVAKSFMSRERLLTTGQTGIAPFPMPVVRFTAICELFAVVGLIVPWLTGIAPVLTPLAALGLVIVMWGAAVSHASLREAGTVGLNIGILLLCALLAAVPFAPRA
jgi:uncharacterized membrane protein YphA (DoxX/SURF4 family)